MHVFCLPFSLEKACSLSIKRDAFPEIRFVSRQKFISSVVPDSDTIAGGSETSIYGTQVILQKLRPALVKIH
jgi:hypothetical protein